MKKFKYLNFMFMAMALMVPACVSCSSDDDGASNYTSEEISELLKGKWTIGGDIKCKTTNIIFEDHYKGTIEFKDNNKFSFSITEGDNYEYQYEMGGGTVGKESTYLEKCFVYSSDTYKILKKGGDNYLILHYSKYPFKIVSLKKNSLKLVLDEDIIDDYILNYNKENGHIYMTILSN